MRSKANPRFFWLAFFVSVFLLGLCGSAAHADLYLPELINEKPIIVTLNESQRGHRNTGSLRLLDPFGDRVLGEYQFVSGGAGRGSLPFGKYEIGAYRDDAGSSFGRDSKEFRRRWMIHQPGLADGEADDRGSRRVLLELHSLHASGSTAGCIGVKGGPAVWDDFVRKMDYLRYAVGSVTFEITGNPEGLAPVRNMLVSGKVHEPNLSSPKWKRHKSAHKAAKHKNKRGGQAKRKLGRK